MEAVAALFRQKQPAVPPPALVSEPPSPDVIVKGWMVGPKGELVHAGARGCTECGGTSGENANECDPECPRYCVAMPTASYSPSLKNHYIVGLWPKLAYEQLGMTKFFDAAMYMRKHKKCDGAMEVAWSFCIGCDRCPVYGIHAIQQPGLDGANFERFVKDFANMYGPGKKHYPASAGVARVTMESMGQGAATTGDGDDDESPFGNADEGRQVKEIFGGRPVLGNTAESILHMLADPALRIEDKALKVVTSEYWPILAKSYLPTMVVKCMESHLGGAKEVSALHKRSEVERLIAAADYDRESRRLLYEGLERRAEEITSEIETIRSLRADVGPKMPEYPPDEYLHSYVVMSHVLRLDPKHCKTLGDKWRTKAFKTLSSAREKSEVTIQKGVQFVEKLGVKGWSNILKMRSKAAVHWPKEEGKKLIKRVKELEGGCDKVQFQVDLGTDIPKYVGYACSERLVQGCLAVYMEQNATWTRTVERAQAVDMHTRHELEELEITLLEKTRAATEPNFETAKKHFIKEQKKHNKKFKWFDGDEVVKEFTDRQDLLMKGHARFFDDKRAMLDHQHKMTRERMAEYYRNLAESPYPLHDFDHESGAPWAPSAYATDQCAQWADRRAEKRDELHHTTNQLLEPYADPDMVLVTYQEQDTHPVLGIMQAKLDSGEISKHEFDIMMSLHDVANAASTEAEREATSRGSTTMVFTSTAAADGDAASPARTESSLHYHFEQSSETTPKARDESSGGGAAGGNPWATASDGADGNDNADDIDTTDADLFAPTEEPAANDPSATEDNDGEDDAADLFAPPATDSEAVVPRRASVATADAPPSPPDSAPMSDEIEGSTEQGCVDADDGEWPDVPTTAANETSTAAQEITTM